MVFPVTFFPSQFTVEVIEGVPTITWTGDWDSLNLSTVAAESIKFVTSSAQVMTVDAGDHVFSTAKDMKVTAMDIDQISGSSTFEVGYGPTVDSTSGWTKLWEGTIATSNRSPPRTMYIPAGNYLTINRISGTGSIRLNSMTVTQEVDADSNLNDDMDGNAP